MKHLLVLASVLALSSCVDSTTYDTTEQHAISDAANGGNAGIFFLAPLVDVNPAFTGPFDGTQSPTIEINSWDHNTSTMGPVVTTFPTVLKYTASETYKVTFRVNTRLGLGAHRINVKVGGIVLGYRDVWVVATNGEVAGVPAGYRGWVATANATIPFRLEPQDPDGDGVPNLVDNCDTVANADQLDGDTDGVGDVCDNCAMAANADQTDGDLDGDGDVCDNCADDMNADQADGDADGIGDVCDNCVVDANADQADLDTDTVGDVCDNCAADANTDQVDTDSDGIGDVCDAACVSVGNGLGHWAGEDNALDGYDLANGTWHLPIAYTPGVLGQSFSFANAYVNTPFTRTNADWTVAFWARASMIQGKNYGLLSSTVPPVDASNTFQIDWGNAGTYRFQGGNNTLNLTIGAANTVAFQHIAVTYNATTGAVVTYLDGVATASGTWTAAPLRFDVLKIGGNRGNNLRFAGAIDDVWVFDSALSASEITQVYGSPSQGGVCE